MPNLAKYNECCGCSACANACPVDCLSMKADATGFIYPVVEEDKCIKCNACEKACPALKEKRNIKPDNLAKHFVVQNTDNEVLMSSTSGGAFTALAKAVIREDGVVFGAKMDEKYQVTHVAVDNVEDLKYFRSSKYVQSQIGDSYKKAREYLKLKRKVLFSGTPCQISGLISYLGQYDENLITVDVMCRAVPSPKVFQKYVEFTQRRFTHIDKLVFRDKALGYSFSTLSVYGEKNGKKIVYRRGKESDEWLRLFFGGYCTRDSCNACKYQSGKRVSDITMWDCFRVYQLAPEMDNNKGATNIITWTEKGLTLLNQASVDLKMRELTFNPQMSNLYREAHEERNFRKHQFYQDLDQLSVEELFNKYTPNSLRIDLWDFLRKTSMRLHIHDSIRKIIHRIRDSKSK